MAFGKVNTNAVKTNANGSVTNPPNPVQARLAGTDNSSVTKPNFTARKSSSFDDISRATYGQDLGSVPLRRYVAASDEAFLDENLFTNISSIAYRVSDREADYIYSTTLDRTYLINRLVVIFDASASAVDGIFGTVIAATTTQITVKWQELVDSTFGAPDSVWSFHLGVSFDGDGQLVKVDQDPKIINDINTRTVARTRKTATAIRNNQWNEVSGVWETNPSTANDASAIGLASDDISKTTYNYNANVSGV